jgi:hypothetical protein
MAPFALAQLRVISGKIAVVDCLAEEKFALVERMGKVATVLFGNLRFASILAVKPMLLSAISLVLVLR